jgi:HTH-type transcriptional regulator / antitoxin HigA
MASGHRRPAEVFPPGNTIREELDARGWTQGDLGEILGRPLQLVNEIIGGNRAITPETARGLGEAFGTGPEFWMNLETSYQLWRDPPTSDNAVARRARLYEAAPVKDMVRRGWIEPSGNVEVLEKRVLDFLEIKTLDEEPNIWPHAARKPTSYDSINPPLCAWLFRAKNLARGLAADRFTDDKHKQALGRLKLLLESPEEIRHVPKILADAGIRLLIVELLPKARIDGVTFWLDETAPVIALSLRYDRIDWFWHALIHEMKHVLDRDGLHSPGSIDILYATHAEPVADRPESERLVDNFAAEFLLPQRTLENFIARVRPLFWKAKIKGFAAVAKVHPGIVVGQLQHRKQISYAHNREMLVKVRAIITSTTLTDGWGKRPPII